MTTCFDPFCLSCYLTFRYVPRGGAEWLSGVAPTLPVQHETQQIAVNTATQALDALRSLLVPTGRTGLLLSGGIDSAILARLLPKGTKAYSIRFEADESVDETEHAKKYADEVGLDFRRVVVRWEDYLEHMDMLMRLKKAPLHAIEVALFVAASAARADGIDELISGNGADSTFGGMDKLLAEDWSYQGFIQRYTFVDPALALTRPASTAEIWAPYRTESGFDVQGFLKEVHGTGITQCFDNAVGAAGVALHQPYESLRYDGTLDIARIRSGDAKYLLREVFATQFPRLAIPQKIAFARPMRQWLDTWDGPTHPEFRQDIPLRALSGDQRWLLYCLDRFLWLLERR